MELSRDGLKEQLTELNVPFANNLKTEKLQALLDAQAHVVTEEDLAENPELVEQGVKVGEEVHLPFAEEVSGEGENELESDETPEDVEDGEPEPETLSDEAEEPEEVQETADYVVVTPVKYQGTRYLEGAELRLNPEIAIPLLDSGAIRQA